jgi:V8-like Glu-specific endopeptidase
MRLHNPVIPSTLALLMTATTVAIAEAGTIRDENSIEDHINLGEYFPAVGLLKTTWVVTAGHCLYDKEDGVTTTTTKATFTIGNNSYDMVEQTYANGWKGDNIYDGYDIGMIRLSAPVTNVKPAELYEGTDEVGNIGYYAGFGRTGDGITGDTIPNDKNYRLAGTNVIDRVGSDYKTNWSSDLLVTDFDSTSGDNVFGSSTPLNLEYNIAPGDSGGGLFIDRDNKYYLAGVNSFGTRGSKYGSISGTTRVSSYVSSIRNVINGNSTTSNVVDSSNGSNSSGSNVEGTEVATDSKLNAKVPEPSMSIFILITSTIFGFSLRKKNKQAITQTGKLDRY